MIMHVFLHFAHVVFRAEPLEVMIYDDWSKLSSKLPIADRHIRLTFTVNGTDVLAMMNVGTIPKLVSYAIKFKTNLEVQKEGASRESKAFRMAMAPRHDNLSAMANAMLTTARSRIKEAGSAFAYAVGQRLSLKLDILQLIVFPRTMRDQEAAQFIGRDIHARLDRLLEVTSAPARRVLHLSFASMSISKVSQLNHALAMKDKSADCRQWLSFLIKGSSEATIFGLPSMDMFMQSDETTEDNVRSIEYDFRSSFKSQSERKDSEDIYISLNMSLYSWLTILRKTFSREMDQAQASADSQRNLSASTSNLPALHRRRAPEPLFIINEHNATLQDSPEPVRTSDAFTPLSSRRQTLPPDSSVPVASPAPQNTVTVEPPSPEHMEANPTVTFQSSKPALVYKPRSRHIERLTMRQLGEATPDVMHPFFMKKAGFNLEESLPQYVHEYATLPTEEIMKALLKLYSRQLKASDTANIPKA